MANHQARQAEKARRAEQKRTADRLLERIDQIRREQICDPNMMEDVLCSIADYFNHWYRVGRWHGTRSAAQRRLKV